MHFETIVRMPSTWTGVHRHLGVHLFENQVTVEQMDEIEVIGTSWRARNPGKVIELVVIFPSSYQMTGAERTRVARLMKRWEADRLASSTVILAEGLVASFQRSILTGLVMLVPPPHPAKIVGTLAEATAWLAPHVSALWQRPVPHAELLSGVSAYCEAFQAREDRARTQRTAHDDPRG